MLHFSFANTKTKQLRQVFGLSKKYKVYSFDLPSGYTCPGAKDCKSRAIVGLNGKATIQDSPQCKFRCFSASQETLFPLVRRNRQNNLNTLKKLSLTNMVKTIMSSIPPDAKIIRLHVGGDFFNLTYLKAWIKVSLLCPHIGFYAYTKSLHLLAKALPLLPNAKLSRGQLTPNFRITASRGGKYDYLIDQLGIREAKVVYSENETTLPIDHTDEHAAKLGGSFALLIHNIQPKNSIAAIALSKLRKKLAKV
jgi:hypothetical protein